VPATWARPWFEGYGKRSDLELLLVDAPAVVRERVPEYEEVYRRLNWKMFPSIGRVYDFRYVIGCLKAVVDFRSSLARAVGSKGYHDEVFSQGPYPVD
jgi:UDP-glucose 4-epimerase